MADIHSVFPTFPYQATTLSLCLGTVSGSDAPFGDEKRPLKSRTIPRLGDSSLEYLKLFLCTKIYGTVTIIIYYEYIFQFFITVIIFLHFDDACLGLSH